MDRLFIRIFIAELAKAGFPSASYDEEQYRVNISPDYSRLYVTCESGEYLVHYDEDSRDHLPVVKQVMDTARMLAAAWRQSTIPGADNYRKLLVWNNIVLAARDDGPRGLYYVTWRYDNDQKGVSHGNYTTSIFEAMKDFAGRSGLVPQDLLFDDEQLETIYLALSYKLENDGGLKPDAVQKIQSLLDTLEPV